MKKIYTFYLLLFFTNSLWAQAPAGYYDAATGQSGNALKLALYNIIKGHVEYPYTATTTDVWDILKESDKDPANANNVILIYTGWSVNAAQEYNSGAGWSREHVWAKSRGNFGTTLGAGTDCHHLRPCDVSVNSARGNRWFAECNEMYYDNGIATGSYTSSTEWVWKPRNEVKGDVARMIFYMATRYEGENGEPDLEPVDYLPADKFTNEPIHALLSDLLLWHQQDPVDNFERNRNEVVYSYQQNRNPFIDHPEYVDSIWGTATVPTNPPAAPQNLTLSPSSTNLSLSWNDVSTEDGYYVYRSKDNVNFSVLTTLGANAVSYIDNNVVEAQTYYYYVIAFNTYGNSTASITVSGKLTTSPGGSATDLFFSEYVEGSSYNKALEVSNFTGADVDLSHFVIKKQTNGAGNWSTGYALSSILATGQSYVVAHSSASQAILNVADATSTTAEFIFNGNDAVSLWKDGVLIDIIGTFNDVANFAKDVTLIRNSNIISPNTVYKPSEWTSYSTDYIANLGTHTFDGGVVPSTCDVPTGLLVSNITASTTDLSWTTVTNSVDYSVQYKTTSATTWTTAIASTNSLSVSGLTPNTQYEFQVATNCSAAGSTYSASTPFTTQPAVVTYCEPAGGTKFEWINHVKLNNVSNTSGQSATGYSDFTNLIANVTAGQTYPLTFQADFSRRFYTEYWSVWIDFNKDGDFADAGERLAQASTTDDGIYYMNITIPANAPAGETRLRVAMNDAGYFDACYSPKYGATEDYMVNISATLKEASILNNQNAQKAEFIEAKGSAVYPNPSSEYIFINNKENAQIEIYSSTGQKVYQSIITNNLIDISQLKSGIYILKFDDGGKVSTQRLIKK